jgi:YHS domain-containing protein
MQRVDGAPVSPERDPVCGRELTREQALLRAETRGREYLFCSERCRAVSSRGPAWFAGQSGTRER